MPVMLKVALCTLLLSLSMYGYAELKDRDQNISIDLFQFDTQPGVGSQCSLPFEYTLTMDNDNFNDMDRCEFDQLVLQNYQIAMEPSSVTLNRKNKINMTVKLKAPQFEIEGGGFFAIRSMVTCYKDGRVVKSTPHLFEFMYRCNPPQKMS